MTTSKERIEFMLSKLPNNCSIEDIQYHLYIFTKVAQGLEVADSEGTRTQKEVEGYLNKWLIR